MKKYILKRLWQMLLVLFLVSVFCFSLVRLIPGDPVKAVFGEVQYTEEEYQELVKSLEPKFVEALTDIYEKVFRIDLQKEHSIVMHLIASTMHKIEGNSNYLIHVSKEDYPYVNMKKNEILASALSANASVELVEDITLGANDCIIERMGESLIAALARNWKN